MDILLVGGGRTDFINAIIDKFNKEGHRIYVLTEKQFKGAKNRKVFEYYYFRYDSDSVNEVMESINPDVIICMGAFDGSYDWVYSGKESVRYSAGMTNLLIAYSLRNKGRFVYLSSDEVYSASYPNNIAEEEPVSGVGSRAMIFGQIEQLCLNYSSHLMLDTIVLRLDHFYDFPKKTADAVSIPARMCLEALKTGKLEFNDRQRFSLLYISDAVEFIYKISVCKNHNKPLYNLSSSEEISEKKVAELIVKGLNENIEMIDNSVGDVYRTVLSNSVISEEFGLKAINKAEDKVVLMAKNMKSRRNEFLSEGDKGSSFFSRLYQSTNSIIKALFPFVENLILFIPFFMLNNRAVDSKYFAKMDFFLLYVLLFAIVYGQQQATFSAVLATFGYIFRQMYQRTGLEVIMDYNTYVWIAQLFILGLVIGHMKDQLIIMVNEKKENVDYLEEQLTDIQDINKSNARIKNVLINQLTNHSDSLGKIYKIISELDAYKSEEVIFYAAEVIGKVMNSKDVAIYVAANSEYAHLYSATSKQARVLGNSVQYMKMNELSLALIEKRAYINRTLDKSLPLMARGIYDNGVVKLIIMVWGIPFERMTLSEVNMLTVVSLLIQNTALKANKYLEAIRDKRYIAGTSIMEEKSFVGLAKACMGASRKNLVEFMLVSVLEDKGDRNRICDIISKNIRQTDYIGEISGKLYVLLFNTNENTIGFVLKRFADNGIKCSAERNLEV